MRRIGIFVVVLAGLLGGLADAAPNPSADGWTPKFYSGLEAAGDVIFDPTGYRGESLAISLKWADGMPKFGASKTFKTVAGSADWTVKAQSKGATGGKVGATAEFFDKAGRSLGLVEGRIEESSDDWKAISWKFSSPAKTDHADIHLLSLDKAPVSFACVAVSAKTTKAKKDIPLKMRVLPVEWNKDWNGGALRMLNFSDAPIPMMVLLSGDLRTMKTPAFEVELPDELELKDAYCPYAKCYGREMPSADVPFERDGRKFRRLRFEKLRLFACPQVMRKFATDEGVGLALVIGPKAGGERAEATFPVVCRTCDGVREWDIRRFDMTFRKLPSGLRTCRNFFAGGWNNADRRLSDDAALMAALKAYEAAGIRTFRLDRNGLEPFERVSEIRRILEARPCPYVFAARLGDLWHLPLLMLTKDELKAMGGNLSKTSDAAGRRADKICPEFFTSDPEMRKQLDKAVSHWLTIERVQDGDWVTMDMEPWQSGTYCYCERCLKAFAAFAKLDHVPSMEEASKMRDTWAEFRVRHSAKSVEIIREAVMKFNPTLKLVDYDYVLDYADPESRAKFIRSCAKDTLMNEQWLDGHLCSYYHKIDSVAFDSMKNNVRHLKKVYVPMGGLSGYASWVRQGEVLGPRQIRQFALAAFANGCPGYAFYSGNCFDGEVLMAMMDAQDIAARYEDLPWGKVDGKTVAKCDSAFFRFASTVRPDGSEVVALFNYDPQAEIVVDVAGEKRTVPPYGVAFVAL